MSPSYTPPPEGAPRGFFTPGARFALLDPVRDAGFLTSNTINNPVSPVNDAGLGVVDNGLFVYTSAYVPGTTTKRQYPIKFFWLGSPAGTTDSNDAFSIYMADVNPAGFYPGAAANAWLVNPRLVLHVTQAGSDIINWFDAHYPGGATGGVGSTGTGSNTTYGTLDGDNTNPGNISRMASPAAGASIDGQFWPIYDQVDNSMILYCSVKTPNPNTLSIYAYKTAANEGMELQQSPLGSSQFLGGLYAPSWSNQFPGVLSSHRFSILSPDPNVAFPRVAGQQTAVVVHSWGGFGTSGPDHGVNMAGSLVTDIHGTPLAPGTLYSPPVVSPDIIGSYPVDKFGSIQTCPSVDGVQAGYSVIFNSPSDRDARGYANGAPVILSAMQLRIAYFNLVVSSGFTFGRDPLYTSYDVNAPGACRPQFTSLPDGVPKLLYANFSFDQNLTLGYTYVPGDLLSPARQSSLYYSQDVGAGTYQLYLYGKRNMRFSLSPATGPSPNAGNFFNQFQMIFGSQANADGTNVGNEIGLLSLTKAHIVPHPTWGVNGYGGYPSSGLEVVVEELSMPWVLLMAIGPNASGQGNNVIAEMY
jgi:hypothetical protein